jgi:hypothetical protein
MPEVEIEDYETKQVTREGYACDKCGKGSVDEPLGEDEIVTVLYAQGAHDRLDMNNLVMGDEVHRQFRCDEHADVRQTVEHAANVASRMERYKELISSATSVLTGGLIVAGLFSALAIGAIMMEQMYPVFANNPDYVGLEWILSAFGILFGSCIGAGVIAHMENN